MSLEYQSKNNAQNYRNYEGKYFFGFFRIGDGKYINRHLLKMRHQRLNRRLWCSDDFVYGKGKTIASETLWHYKKGVR